MLKRMKNINKFHPS